jgi:hypothetical protein
MGNIMSKPKLPTRYIITYEDNTKETFKCHPIFTNYAASKNGDAINLKTMRIIGTLNGFGYIKLTLYQNGTKTMMKRSHFIFECFYGLIKNQDCVKANPNGNWIIDHIDNEQTTNDALSNLQLLTSSENSKKSYSQGRKKFTIGNKERSKIVIATNLITEEETEFPSIYKAGKVVNICPSSIQKCCDKITKSATSKTDGVKYTFNYKN